MTELTIPQIKAKLTDAGIPFKSKAKKDELLALLPAETVEAAPEVTTDDVVIIDDLSGKQAEITEAVATTAHAVVDRQSKPKVMGLHYRGRAMGAKHYKLISAIQHGVTKPGERKNFTPAVALPNSERVQKYARQQQLTNPDPITRGCPTLTPKQMRRLRKSDAKQTGGTSFVYVHGTAPLVEGEYSVVGRTPQGASIQYRFAK